jgi:hypothetical protein
MSVPILNTSLDGCLFDAVNITSLEVGFKQPEFWSEFGYFLLTAGLGLALGLLIIRLSASWFNFQKVNSTEKATMTPFGKPVAEIGLRSFDLDTLVFPLSFSLAGDDNSGIDHKLIRLLQLQKPKKVVLFGSKETRNYLVAAVHPTELLHYTTYSDDTLSKLIEDITVDCIIIYDPKDDGEVNPLRSLEVLNLVKNGADFNKSSFVRVPAPRLKQVSPWFDFDVLMPSAIRDLADLPDNMIQTTGSNVLDWKTIATQLLPNESLIVSSYPYEMYRF